MPIRSQPYDPFASPATPPDQNQPPQDEVRYSDAPPLAEEPRQDLQEGTGIHQRKSEFMKRFAETNVYNSMKEPTLEMQQAEAEPLDEPKHQNKWLIFMIVAIIAALFLFMANPLIETFFGNSSTHIVDSIRSFISFSAPIIVIISALAGTAGYFNFVRVAWLLIGGFSLGVVLYFLSSTFGIGKFNFGIYWILIGSFMGGLASSITEFITLRKYHLHKELQPLFIIGMAAFFIGGFFLVQSTISRNVELLSYQQVGKRVNFQIYEPSFLPEKFNQFEPKIIYENGQVSIYYGPDSYPPPPVIDFLTGIEFIQSQKVDSSYQNEASGSETDVQYVDIDNSIARFTERRGRATLEWDEDQTHVVMNVYNNIAPRDIFKMARELQPVKSLKSTK